MGDLDGNAALLADAAGATYAGQLGIILVGVFFISRTPFRTAGTDGHNPVNPDSPRP